MGRPLKFTVDYFSHDSNASTRKTLGILFNNFQHEGVSAWWQLLEIIASTDNHVIRIKTPEDLEYLASKMRFHTDRLKEILDKIASLGAIDPELYSQGLIWSQNFVDRIKSVYDSRKQEIPLKPLVSLAKNQVSLPDNTQTKLKETKLNKTKGKETKGSAEGKTLPPADFESYKESLRDEFKDLNFDMEIRKFETYWSEGNRKLQRPKSALLNWLTKAREFRERDNGTAGRNSKANTNQGTNSRDPQGPGGDRTSQIAASIKKYNGS